jgi:hypothetical protein
MSTVTSSKGWGDIGMKKEKRWDRERRVEGVGINLLTYLSLILQLSCKKMVVFIHNLLSGM